MKLRIFVITFLFFMVACSHVPVIPDPPCFRPVQFPFGYVNLPCDIPDFTDYTVPPPYAGGASQITENIASVYFLGDFPEYDYELYMIVEPLRAIALIRRHKLIIEDNDYWIFPGDFRGDFRGDFPCKVTGQEFSDYVAAMATGEGA